MDAFLQNDINKRHEAEGEDYVGYDWQEGEIYPGEEVYVLMDNAIVKASDEDIQEYLMHRIKKIGLEKWVTDELGESSIESFIMSVLSDSLTLEDMIESYYGGYREEATKQF